LSRGLPLAPVKTLAEEGRTLGPALVATAPWLALLALAWAMSLSPFLLSRLRRVWPEQVALLALLGWSLAGPTSLVLSLLAIAVMARGVLLVQWLRWLFRRSVPVARPSSHGT
jgi:hypothetical protein